MVSLNWYSLNIFKEIKKWNLIISTYNLDNIF